MTSATLPRYRAVSPLAVDTQRVPAILRLALVIFVVSIPFEWPGRIIPLEIPTATGFLLLAATFAAPDRCYRRLPSAAVIFGLYLWVWAIALLAARMTHGDLAFRLFVSQSLVIALFWALGNLLSDPRTLRLALLAFIVACALRALAQVLQIGTTSVHEWTGGDRVTVLGQNANLSAIILSAGLVATVGVRHSSLEPPWWLRLGWMPLAALMGVALLQTGSRGGLICGAAGMAAFALRGATLTARLRSLTLALVGVGALVIAVSQSELMRERFAGTSGGHLAGRERIYPAAAAAFREKPLIGWGPIANQYEIARRMREGAFNSRDAHNLLLELLSATGVLGAIPFLTGIALVLRHAWRARQGRAGILPFALVLATLAGTASGTWIAAKVLWLAFAVAVACDAPTMRSPLDTRRAAAT